MDVSLSRRIAKLMMTESMIEIGIRRRSDFIDAVSKYDKFEDLPFEYQILINSIEKSEKKK